MYQIEYDKAIELLLNSNLSLNYDAYYDVYLELQDIYRIDCFNVHGFVIFKVFIYDYYNERSFPHIYLHQIEKDADLNRAISFVQDDPTLEKKYALFAFIPGEAPQKYAECERTVKFVRSGFEFHDPDVRELTKEDTDLINKLASVPHDAEDIEKRVSRDLTDWFERHDLDITRIFGIFVGKTLVGVISTRCFEELGIVMPDVLFVKNPFRNHGYGTRLTKSVMGEYQVMKHVYQTDIKNKYSLKIARSLGFEFIGEMIRIV